MGIWNTADLDVRVRYDDFQRAHEKALERGEDVDVITVEAEVDVDDALEHASVEQLRDALSRENEDGYTQDQLGAIHDCFAALVAGDVSTAAAMIGRIFEHGAQKTAAESGMGLFSHRKAA